MDFSVISASEIVPSYRAWCEENHPGRFLHFYGSLQEQLDQDGLCELCKNSELVAHLGQSVCDPSKSLRLKSCVDLMVSGSPCDPFSVQRNKRWQDGSVNHHYQFDVTMKSVLDLYLKYEPAKGVLEQVMGFLMPFAAGAKETPKDRRDGMGWNK